MRYDTKMRHISKSLDETYALAFGLAEALPRLSSELPDAALVFALHGDLGSGKTAFVQGIARALGISRSVTSPTFVIEKRYDIEKPLRFTSLVHIDAYRFKEGRDMRGIKWEETVANPNNLVFLEWPDIVADALPNTSIPLRFTFLDDHTRAIEFPEI